MIPKVKIWVLTLQWLESLSSTSAFSNVGFFLCWTRNICMKYLTPYLSLNLDWSCFIHINGIVRVLPDWFVLLGITSKVKLQVMFWDTNRRLCRSFPVCSFPGGYKDRENIWTRSEICIKILIAAFQGIFALWVKQGPMLHPLVSSLLASQMQAGQGTGGSQGGLQESFAISLHKLNALLIWRAFHASCPLSVSNAGTENFLMFTWDLVQTRCLRRQFICWH